MNQVVSDLSWALVFFHDGLKLLKLKISSFACWIILMHFDWVTDSDNCWISVEDPKPDRTVPS